MNISNQAYKEWWIGEVLNQLEQKIASPSADPARIAALVATLPSDTVDAPRNLSEPLLQRLHEIAEAHGGSVPLHGRLFAQWMHHAFPRECPYPHVSGTTIQENQNTWTDANGGDSVATQEELEQFTSVTNSSDLTEPVDEYAIQALPEFDGKRFHNVAKEGLDIDQGAKAKKQMADFKEEFQPLCTWLKDFGLKDMILDAEVSERLTDTPAALVASSYGWSGNMQRIMEAQAYKSRADSSQSFYAKQKKKFEINPRHPLIKNLNERIQKDEDDEVAMRNAKLMFDTATLRSDFELQDKQEFAGRILDIMYQNLGIESGAEIEEEPADIDDDEEEEEEDDEEAEEMDAEEEDDEEEDEAVEVDGEEEDTQEVDDDAAHDEL